MDIRSHPSDCLSITNTLPQSVHTLPRKCTIAYEHYIIVEPNKQSKIPKNAIESDSFCSRRVDDDIF